eukprot:g26452.t1
MLIVIDDMLKVVENVIGVFRYGMSQLAIDELSIYPVLMRVSGVHHFFGLAADILNLVEKFLELHSPDEFLCVCRVCHPTIRLTMDYSSELVSFLDTRISIKDGYFSTSLYHNPMDKLMILHFSSFHPKHIKETFPYGQAKCIHRICSDEEEHDGHLKVLKDTLVRMRYDAQLIDHQLRRGAVKNHNKLFRRQTQDMTDRLP